MERRTTYRRTIRFILCGTAILAGLAWSRLAADISGWWPLILGLMAIINFRNARVFSLYLVIVLGFVAGMTGMLVPVFWGWFAWPARYLLIYLLDVAVLVSRILNMNFSFSIGSWSLVFMYTAIITITLIWWQKYKNYSSITDVKESNPVY